VTDMHIPESFGSWLPRAMDTRGLRELAQ
jgi:hypothetical protein